MRTRTWRSIEDFADQPGVGIRQRDERRHRTQRHRRRSDQRACRDPSAATPPRCWRICPDLPRSSLSRAARWSRPSTRSRRATGAPRRRSPSAAPRWRTLVATLDLKSDDLEQRLQRFTALLDQSLNGAESRAREIGRMIAESSTTGTRTIAEQFELVRETTEQDSKRTSDRDARDLRAIDRRDGRLLPAIVGALRRDARRHEGDGCRDAGAARTDPRRTASRHPRIASGNRRECRADAPRDRRPDRGAGRTQSHRQPSWTQHRSGRAAPRCGADAGRGRRWPSPNRHARKHGFPSSTQPPARPAAPPPAAPRGEAYPQGAASWTQPEWLAVRSAASGR